MVHSNFSSVMASNWFLVTSTLQQGRRVHRNLRTFFGRVGVVMPTVMNVTYLHFLRHDRRWLSQSLMAEEKTVPPGCPNFCCIHFEFWMGSALSIAIRLWVLSMRVSFFGFSISVPQPGSSPRVLGPSHVSTSSQCSGVSWCRTYPWNAIT